jgi:hypothetical protein
MLLVLALLALPFILGAEPPSPGPWGTIDGRAGATSRLDLGGNRRCWWGGDWGVIMRTAGGVGVVEFEPLSQRHDRTHSPVS